MKAVSRIERILGGLIRRAIGGARSRLAPWVAGRPFGRFGPAYALEFRVSPNVWIVKRLHL
jgi:hypothetical protein